MTGSKNANETIAAAPDDLLKVGKDANIELTEEQLKGVAGGGAAGADKMKQLQDMTNNQQTTAQKAADKVDQYIRS